MAMRIVTIHDDCEAGGGSDAYRRTLTGALRRRGVETALVTGAVLLLLVATFNHPRLKLCHQARSEEQLLQDVRRTFSPLFAVLREEQTNIVEGTSTEPPMPGVACWLALR